MRKNKGNVKGQITLFIIIAIVIVIAIVLLSLFWGKMFASNIPREFEPIYSYYLSCIESETQDGAKLLGEKGGRIEDIEFNAGSTYMPFSNQLGFMEIGIPYWYYITGNGISREQVPSKEKMQNDLNNFLKEGLKECDFSQLEKKGYQINISDPVLVKSEIKDNFVKVNVKQNIALSFGNSKWSASNHNVDVSSNIGKFFDLALKIYKNQKSEMFLEKYGIDIIRLYAPVDGSEISCSPKIWKVNDIRTNLSNALEANTGAIKIKGNYYKLKDKENKYFIRDIGEITDFNINFMYSKYWPTKMEVWPSEEGLLRADPIGLEQGLGIIGFCYVPYHFVYDLYYPVLVQIYSGGEMFQFPVVVAIDKTKPQTSLEGESQPDAIPELCEHKLTRMSIYTYNANMQPVEADIKFKCFDTSCDIGKTKLVNDEAVLSDNFPQCSNGYVIASSESYETKKEIVSTVVDGSANIILSRKYKLNLVVHERGSNINGYAVVSLTKNNKTSTFAYPEMKEIELSEGQYNIKAYVYSNTSIYLQGTDNNKCVDVPVSGVGSLFGATEQKCFNINIPAQDVNFAVSGGGISSYYFAESELEKSKTLLINVQHFGVPNTIEGLQKNFNLAEVSNLNIQIEED